MGANCFRPFCQKKTQFLPGSCNKQIQQQEQQHQSKAKQTKDVLGKEEYENVLNVTVLGKIFVIIIRAVDILDLVLCTLYFVVCWNTLKTCVLYFLFCVLKEENQKVLIACVSGQDIWNNNSGVCIPMSPFSHAPLKTGHIPTLKNVCDWAREYKNWCQTQGQAGGGLIGGSAQGREMERRGCN